MCEEGKGGFIDINLRFKDLVGTDPQNQAMQAGIWSFLFFESGIRSFGAASA
jgi:hypothetical protein